MKDIEILDCTLRDGGRIIDGKFQDNEIIGIGKFLKKSNIDIIELGFLRDNINYCGNSTFFGTVAQANYYAENIGEGNQRYVLFVDYGLYNIDNLDERNNKRITGIRYGFTKKNYYEHRDDIISEMKMIQKKGYDLYVQTVFTNGYTTTELLELIGIANEINPVSFGIIDTYGSMYLDDLDYIWNVVNHNLKKEIAIDFHSHNNMQLSSSLSQAFLRMNGEKRKGIIDGTISGMGRGAGNTPTELIAEYMVRKLGYDYNMDALLDMIDSYMDNIRAKCTWGYSTPYFIAGCYSAHVNNVTYLTQKSSIRSKDIRFILNKIGAAARKRYPYDLLEKTYLGYLQSDIDDSEAMSKLKNVMKGKNVVVIAPGQTATAQCSLIQKYIEENNAVVIMVNFVHDEIMGDFVYMSNVKRYRYWIHTEKFQASHKILTSNIIDENVNDKDTFVVSFAKLVKCGWEHLDNSSIMLLRLLDAFELKQLAIAGLDGYHYFADGKLNYVNQELELSNVKENPMELNQEIQDMLKDFMKSRKQKYNIRFITESRFSSIVE